MSGEFKIDTNAEYLVNAYSEKFLLYNAGQEFFRTPSTNDLVSILKHFPNPKDLSLTSHIILGTYSFFDSIYALIAEQVHQTGQKIYCAPGCTECCKQVILSNPFEATLIGMHLLKNESKRVLFEKNYARWAEETAEMRVKFQKWVAQQRIYGVDDKSFDQMEFTATCPFLVENLCNIYQYRPYSCRSYVALSDKCKEPDDPKQRPGRQGIGIGMSTTFHHRRSQLLNVLWKHFGINIAKKHGHFLPELVKCVLDGDNERIFKLCL